MGGKNLKVLKNQVEVGKSGTTFPEIGVGEESRRSVDRLIGGGGLWRGFNRVANGKERSYSRATIERRASVRWWSSWR